MESKEKALEALSAQAVDLAAELSQVMDKDDARSYQLKRRLRHLAIPAFEAMSKIVLLLLKQEQRP